LNYIKAKIPLNAFINMQVIKIRIYYTIVFYAVKPYYQTIFKREKKMRIC